MICAREGKKTQYFGESGRTGYDRGAEHLASLNAEDDKSTLVEHWKGKHPGVQWEYQHRIIKSYANPLQRQVHEGHLISSFKGDEVLNRKGEWGENLPPKIIIEDQREGAAKGESKGPQLEKTGAKRRTASGQETIGQIDQKRARIEHMEEPIHKEDEEPKFLSKKSKVPKGIRREIVERERTRELQGKKECDASETCLGVDLANQGLSEDSGRPPHCSLDPLTKGLVKGAQLRIENMGSNVVGEKVGGDQVADNPGLANESIKAGLNHKSDNSILEKLDSVQPRISLKRRQRQESVLSRPEETGGDQTEPG